MLIASFEIMLNLRSPNIQRALVKITKCVFIYIAVDDACRKRNIVTNIMVNKITIFLYNGVGHRHSKDVTNITVHQNVMLVTDFL